PNFVKTEYPLAQKGATWQGRIPVGPPTWQSLILPYDAFVDPTNALSLYKQNRSKIGPVNPMDLIDNDAFNVHWIEQLLQYGRVDETVTANTISYQAFFNPTTQAHTFVAYNPGATPLQVPFTYDNNGTSTKLTVTVAPFSTGVFDQTGRLLTQPLTDPNFAVATPQNRFFFTTTSGSPTLTYGKTGAGITAANTLTWDGQKPLTF